MSLPCIYKTCKTEAALLQEDFLAVASLKNTYIQHALRHSVLQSTAHVQPGERYECTDIVVTNDSI